jgi:hypothetical protein
MGHDSKAATPAQGGASVHGAPADTTFASRQFGNFVHLTRAINLALLFTLLALILLMPATIVWVTKGDAGAPYFEDGQRVFIERVSAAWTPYGPGEIVGAIDQAGGGHRVLARVLAGPNETVVLCGQKFVSSASEFILTGLRRPTSICSAAVAVVARDDIYGRVVLSLYPRFQILPGRALAEEALDTGPRLLYAEAAQVHSPRRERSSDYASDECTFPGCKSRP